MTKKANGVYYTPRPVVDYIVRGTLAPLVEGKSPMQLAGCTESWQRDSTSHPLTVLDPACGTGNFLLGAFHFLSEWCLRWYSANEPERWLNSSHPTLVRDGPSLVLHSDEQQRIARQHIFGVDIDEAALQIARRTLAEAGRPDQAQRSSGASREIPRRTLAGAVGQCSADLSNNIRCGNSLIGSDVGRSTQQGATCAIRPIDWEQAFPTVMAAGGFDAIVGNPPYVNARLVKQEQGEAVKRYYRERYRCARRAFDLYVLFIERSHELLRQHGRAGLIVPNKLATLDYARGCRELLLTETTLDTITDVSDEQLFRDASVYPYIITWTKHPPPRDHRIRIVTLNEAERVLQANGSRHIQQASWSADTGFAIHDTIDVESRVETQPLSQCGVIHSGTTGFCAERIADSLHEGEAADAENNFDFIVSGNIDRYSISLGNVRFMKRVFQRPVLPIDSPCLTKNKRELFAHPKLVIAGMSRHLEAAFDAGGLALGVQVYAVANLKCDPRFLLGLLNSKLMSYLLRSRFPAKRLASGYLAINKSQLAKLPIRLIDETDRQAIRLRNEIIGLVNGFHQPNVETDQAIDQLVGQLYKLTEKEIETVQQYPM